MRPHIILSTFSQAVQHWSIVYRCSGYSAVVHLRSATSSQWFIPHMISSSDSGDKGGDKCSSLTSGTVAAEKRLSLEIHGPIIPVHCTCGNATLSADMRQQAAVSLSVD